MHISEPFTFYGAAAGSFVAPVFSGTFQVVPTDGDCFTTPVQQSEILMQGFLVRP